MSTTMEAPAITQVLVGLEGKELTAKVSELASAYEESQDTQSAAELIAETRRGAVSWATAYDIALGLLGTMVFTKSQICTAFEIGSASADNYFKVGQILAKCELNGASRASVVTAVNAVHRQKGASVTALMDTLGVKWEKAAKKGEKVSVEDAIKVAENIVSEAQREQRRLANPPEEVSSEKKAENALKAIEANYLKIKTLVDAGHTLDATQSTTFNALKAIFTK